MSSPAAGKRAIEYSHFEVDLELVAQSRKRPRTERCRRKRPWRLAHGTDLERLQHRSRTVNKQADGIAAPGGKVTALEHALVEACAEQQRRVWGKVASIEAGAQPASLVGKEQGIQLAGDPALHHTPLPGSVIEQLASLGGEAAELVGERTEQRACPSARWGDRSKEPGRHGPVAR